jgi:histidinol-phosphate aminotransferase
VIDASIGRTTASLRLHFNENTAGCSPSVVQALAKMTPAEISAYPDVGPITRKTAGYLNVAPTQVMLTNGLDEGIQATTTWAARSMAGCGRRPEVIVVEPTFEMYAEFAAIAGATLLQIEPDDEFRFPLDAVLRAIAPETRAIYLTDPNNPTGLPVPVGVAERIARHAPQAKVFVDEAYADFSGRTLIGPLLETCRNVIVGRTFAKGHGLAGLRIGAVVAHADTIADLRQLVPPFSVNSCAIVGLSAALDDQPYLDWYLRETVASRELVYAFCRRHGLKYWPSEGNFVLIRTGSGTTDIVADLETRGVSVRDKSPAPGCAGCIRLTAGVVAHTTIALGALEACLASRTN